MTKRYSLAIKDGLATSKQSKAKSDHPHFCLCTNMGKEKKVLVAVVIDLYLLYVVQVAIRM
jgi:hypothetical protein